MKKICLTWAVIAIVVIAACKKSDIDKTKAKFIGTWHEKSTIPNCTDCDTAVFGVDGDLHTADEDYASYSVNSPDTIAITGKNSGTVRLPYKFYSNNELHIASFKWDLVGNTDSIVLIKN